MYLRDRLYFSALGHHRLRDHPASRRCLEHLLHINPQNEHALKLMETIDKRVKAENVVGYAIGAGIAAGAGMMFGLPPVPVVLDFTTFYLLKKL